MMEVLLVSEMLKIIFVLTHLTDKVEFVAFIIIVDFQTSYI